MLTNIDKSILKQSKAIYWVRQLVGVGKRDLEDISNIIQKDHPEIDWNNENKNNLLGIIYGILNPIPRPKTYLEDEPQIMDVYEKGSTYNVDIPLDELDVCREETLKYIAMKDRERASELLVELVIKNKHIYTTRSDEKPEMWIYCDGIYIPEGKTYVKEVCRVILGDFYTTHLVNLVIGKIETDTYVNFNDFFKVQNINEIAINNGILDLTTREVTPFNPEKIFFNKVPVDYNKDAVCPSIEQHFKTVLKHEDDLSVVWEIFGFCLKKEYFIEKAIMFVGDGRNGKGKSVELLKLFLGSENCANVPLQQLESDNFAAVELFHKMANISADLDSKALKRTGYFKSLTGRDMISAPRKFLPRVHFVNFAKMIFCANELPRTYDTTPAFWHRWILLEFPFTFVTQAEIDQNNDGTMLKIKNPDIMTTLTTPQELSGLKNKALDGLERMVKNHSFSYSKNTEEVKTLWIRKSDSFSAFLMDMIIEDYDSKISKKEMRRQYSAYCKRHKLKTVSDKSIRASLSDLGVVDDIFREDYNNISYWDGIKFKGGKIAEMGHGFNDI